MPVNSIPARCDIRPFTSVAQEANTAMATSARLKDRKELNFIPPPTWHITFTASWVIDEIIFKSSAIA